MADEIDFSVADTAPVLRRGDQGPWVHYLQQLLWACGYHEHTIDESFGSETEEAVKRFQAWIPVEVNGVVDRDLWASLVKNAATMEELDTTRGEIAGSRDADHAKLAPGAEVGLNGWQRANFHCIVRDWQHVNFGAEMAYVRFSDEQGRVADDGAHMVDGVLQLNDIWLPSRGEVHLYVQSQQPSPSGELGDVSGAGALSCAGDWVIFEATQTQGPTATFSEQEAYSRGWMEQGQLNSKVSILIVDLGSQLTAGTSGSTTETTGNSLQITFPGPGFSLQQTR